MAINFKDLKHKLDTTPISEVELKLIQDVEDYIDEQILEEYDKTIYREVLIDMVYVRFSYSPKTKSSIQGLGQSRIPKMSNELERRYRVAGWDVTYRLDDGSLAGSDYMILKGKVTR